MIIKPIVMKNKCFVLVAVAASITLLSCNQKSDKKATTVDSAGYTTNNDTNIIEHDGGTMPEAGTKDMKDDDKFLIETYQAGLFEIEASKLAQKNAASAEVKVLAKKIENDHNKANNQISALAKKNNVSLSNVLTDKNQSKYNDLTALTGKDFDKKYVNEMVDSHKIAIDEFEKKSKNANSPEIQEFAVKTLPTLTAHKAEADVLKEKI
ncbi:DUF4142 domain-containing protein [Solitalea lacus]|uniref:DUF4142 domain-containing protein n=1 Tax=Solitalea lacus TaxID=2911172 RepID=UPI001EDC5DD8|nr:DUF4142 domain-containing protein [Solitalea lacus]UKJ08535.1 DUF4142 domain-containing protein [Solitalea lacus]